MTIIKDALSRFIARYERVVTAVRDFPHKTLAELNKVRDAVMAILDPIKLPDLDQTERDDLSGKRLPATQDLIMKTAAGLAECQEIADDIGATPAEFEAAARLDMSIGGVISATTALGDAADTGMLLAYGEGSDLCQQAQDGLDAMHNDDKISVALRNSLEYAVNEPIRLRKEADARPRATPAGAPAEAAALDDQKTQENTRQLIYRMLTDAREGRDAVLSPVLRGLPAPAAPGSAPAGHKKGG